MGLGLGLGLGLALVLGSGCSPASDDCGGFCGEGTVCQSQRCVVAPPPAADPEPAPEPDSRGKRRRRGRKRRGGSSQDGGDSAPAGLDDRDGHIPRYRPDRNEQIGEGGERLSDRRVRQELSRLEPAFNRCLSRASEVTEDPLRGGVTFQIGIEPTGKVWGVNARLPDAWNVPGLRACFRKVVHGHRFPTWNGPAMGIDYHFQVD